jgi:hypothetical protein
MAGVAVALIGGSLLGGYLKGRGAESAAHIQSSSGIESTKISADAQKEIAKLRSLTDLELAKMSRQTGIDIQRLKNIADLDIAEINSLTSREIANLQAQTGMDIAKINNYAQLMAVPTALEGQDVVARALGEDISGRVGVGLTEEEKQVYRGAGRTGIDTAIKGQLEKAKQILASQGLRGGSVADILGDIELSQVGEYAGLESNIMQADIAKKAGNIQEALAFMNLRGAPTRGDIKSVYQDIGRVNPAFVQTGKFGKSPAFNVPEYSIGSALTKALNKKTESTYPDNLQSMINRSVQQALSQIKPQNFTPIGGDPGGYEIGDYGDPGGYGPGTGVGLGDIGDMDVGGMGTGEDAW